MAFNIRVWFVPFGLHLASPILGSSLSLLTLPFLPFPAYGPLRGGWREPRNVR